MKKLRIQLNIPFCAHRCSYCVQANCRYDASRMHAYAMAVMREIETYRNEFDDYTVEAVCIDGGSPALVPAADLAAILRKLKDVFHVSENAFISVCTMPGEYSRAFLDRLRDNGVNFYIVSIPTIQESLHNLLSRPYNLDAITMADTAIRNFRMRDLSFEVMYGIPGQSEKDVICDLEKTFSYNSEHYTLYPLIIHSSSRIAEQCAPVSTQEKVKQFIVARQLLEQKGYRQYTSCDFALAGKENRYILMQDETMDQIGIGYHADTLLEGIRYHNGPDINTYMNSSDNPEIITCNACRLSDADMRKLKLIHDLHRLKQVDDPCEELQKAGYVKDGRLTVEGMCEMAQVESIILKQ
ncbi:MAG: radical SAM protein [Bulleidia sp.]